MLRLFAILTPLLVLGLPAQAGDKVSVGVGVWFGSGGYSHYHHRYRHYDRPYRSHWHHRHHWSRWHRRPRTAILWTPPPVYYVPPPKVVVRAPTCRVFRGDAIIDASGRPFYGTACLHGDGRWHIVN